MECYGKYYYLDGLICTAGSEITMPEGDASFYEVIRTFAGIPLFFGDHMERLSRGIMTRYPLPDNLTKRISSAINLLAECDLIPEVNVRVVVTFTGQQHSLIVSYIPSSYPDEKMYREGVSLMLWKAVRNEPGVKMLNVTLRSEINEGLRKRKAYEALLVTPDGVITEGSRSNIFFISSEGALYTAPDRMVLQGITRKYIIELCRDEGIPVVFDPVKAEELNNFASAFITGTSPMVLAVSSIEELRFEPVNQVSARLRTLYSARAEESIRQFLTRRTED